MGSIKESTPEIIVALHANSFGWKFRKIKNKIKKNFNWTRCDTIECYLAIKKNEILPFAMTWVELECIKLSKISQSEKDTYRMISLIYGI